MKKYMFLCAGLCLAVTFTGCKSQETAYRKMYEKSQAQENQAVATERPTDEVATA